VTSPPSPQQPGGIAAVGDRYVALVAVAARVLQVYDARSLKPLGSTSAGIGPTHVVTLGDDAYVADTEGGLVREYRVGPQPRQIATVPAPGAPYGIAVDRHRHRLWVTLTASNRLAEYAIGIGRPRAQLGRSRPPNR
jgi:DNA-binding beta-propeller fold protein YncE